MLATLAPRSRAQSHGDHQDSHQRRNERDEPVVPSYSDARIFAGLLGVVHFLVLLCVSAFTAGAVYAVPTCKVAVCRSGEDRRGRRGDPWLRIPSLMIDARFATFVM